MQPVRLVGPPKKVQRNAVRGIPLLSGLGLKMKHSSFIEVYSTRCTADESRYSLSSSEAPSFSQISPMFHVQEKISKDMKKNEGKSVPV